jgi:hypothetical protein
MASGKAATYAGHRALFSPWADALAIGGVSVLVFSVVLILKLPSRVFADTRLVLALGILVNWPHFMASYRLLYNSKANIQRHPWASIYVPVLLLLYAGLAVILSLRQQPVPLALLDYLGAVYLAWHYTGQGWGATASFAYLAGITLQTWERIVLRLGFRVLLVLHLTLYHFYTRSIPLIPHIGLASNLSVAGAAVVFWLISRRTGKPVPLRMVLPLASLYLGYLLFAFYGHAAFFMLQISHALQYLVFAARVELNRVSQPKGSASKRMVIYYTCLVGTGLLMFKGITGVGDAFRGNPATVATLAASWANVISIHHYFVDGCIWKLRNPEVRRDLFNHLAVHPLKHRARQQAAFASHS